MSEQRLLAALLEPRCVIHAAGAAGLSPPDAVPLLVSLVRAGRVEIFCRDHFVVPWRRACWQDGAPSQGWPPSRRIIAAIGNGDVSVEAVAELVELPRALVVEELVVLSELGAVIPAPVRGLIRRRRGDQGAILNEDAIDRMLAETGLLARFDEPRIGREVARELAGSFPAVESRVRQMARLRRLRIVGRDLLIAATVDWKPTDLAEISRPAREQPVRDGILAYLSQPRRALEIARHMARSVPNITGHLRAMQRQKLVVRLGYGVYAPAIAPYLSEPGSKPTPRPRSLELIPGFLDQPRTVQEVMTRFGIGEGTARAHLQTLTKRGVLVEGEDGLFRRAEGHGS